MKRWHALHTLAIVYRDAFNNQLNDRYLAKWQRISELSRKARDDTTLQFGIGLVMTPIPQAQAPAIEHGAGVCCRRRFTTCR